MSQGNPVSIGPAETKFHAGENEGVWGVFFALGVVCLGLAWLASRWSFIVACLPLILGFVFLTLAAIAFRTRNKIVNVYGDRFEVVNGKEVDVLKFSDVGEVVYSFTPSLHQLRFGRTDQRPMLSVVLSKRIQKPGQMSEDQLEKLRELLYGIVSRKLAIAALREDVEWFKGVDLGKDGVTKDGQLYDWAGLEFEDDQNTGAFLVKHKGTLVAKTSMVMINVVAGWKAIDLIKSHRAAQAKKQKA